MGKILVVDDTQFWRDTAADILRSKGHDVFTAADGVEGLAALRRDGADLILLDVEMPRMSGLHFLGQVRQNKDWKDLPVIMLTGDTVKDDILLAKKLGAVDYILKSRFSVSDLLERVCKRIPLAGARPTAPAVSTPLPAAPRQAPEPAPAGGEFKSLLTREQSIQRVETAIEGRALPGVVTEVIALTDSSRAEISDLAGLIGRDSVLTARVIQTANSAAYASHRKMISTLAEAVRIVGSAVIRDIAASVGLFESMPPPGPDGFNPVQCWQHSLAAATICTLLAREENRGLAYVVGLCHNLGELLFRGQFGAEYRQVLDAKKSSGKPTWEVERAMLGISRGELVERILRRLALPPAVCNPIIAYHRGDRRGAAPNEPLARVLTVASSYASGMLLEFSDDNLIRPWTRPEIRDVTGKDEQAPPDASRLRSELFALTSICARLSQSQQDELRESCASRRPVRLWLAREEAFSPIDPISAAFDGLAEATICNALPTFAESGEYHGLVILAREPTALGFTLSDIIAASSTADASHLPTLWLTSRLSNSPTPVPPHITCALWPTSMNYLEAFISTVAQGI